MLAVAFLLAAGTLARAQDSADGAAPPALPAFEAVSVKRFLPPTGHVWNRTPRLDPQRLSIEGMTLHDLILYAYDLSDNQLTGLPDWAVRTFFEVTGVTGQPASPDQMRLMLQGVLVQRFRFAFTESDAARPVHALVVAPGGPKMQRWTSDSDCTSAVLAIERQKAPELPRPVLSSFATCSIPDLMKELNRPRGTSYGLPVIDETGLTGLYPMWVWQGMVPSGPGRFHPEPFQEAVKRELGLELVKTTAPYRVLHTTRIALPAAN